MSGVLDVSCSKHFISTGRGAASVALTAKVVYNVLGQVREEKCERKQTLHSVICRISEK